VQIAQAAFAIFDIWLDQVARLAGAAMALLAFGKLGGDEFGGCVLHDFLVEAVINSSKSLRSPSRKRASRLRWRMVCRLGLTDTIRHRSRGMAYFEAHVHSA